MTIRASILISLASLSWAAIPLAAEPFIPSDDAVVLERLPSNSSGDRQMAELRAALAENPTDVETATGLAWRYVAIGRAEADPRYYGYAQATLNPWWSQSEPPPEVLLLRATLRQNRHDFAGALEDLDQLLRVEPRNTQAWLTRATVQQVQGDVAEAARSCLPLRRSDPLLAAGCLASAAGLGGRAEQSYQLLRQTLDNATAVDSSAASIETRLWVLTTLAEIAERLGRDAQAEQHFREALALGQRDVYLLGAWADFLLDHDRASEVAELLVEERRADSLLLRLALAQAQLGEDTHVETLKQRFAEAQRRGDGLHSGAEARFRLHLLDDAPGALRLALDNWQHQREPIDARLVLESALAADTPEAARPVIELIERTGLEDIRLTALIGRWQEEIVR